MARLRITYKKSWIGYSQKQRATVQALGLHKLHQTVEHDDSPVIRGMINKVAHLVAVEKIEKTDKSEEVRA
jgi:large subunit ribosomal protein L30